MENASKALIMAGAVLIAIIIISLGVIVFRNMSGSVERSSDLTQEQISSFNNRILPYVRDNISGSQVNALIQTARSITQKALNEKNNTQKITVVYKDGSSTDNAFIYQNGSTVEAKSVSTGDFYKVEAESPNNNRTFYQNNYHQKVRLIV